MMEELLFFLRGAARRAADRHHVFTGRPGSGADLQGVPDLQLRAGRLRAVRGPHLRADAGKGRAGPFWSWTGWLAVAFALLAAGIWGLRRYTTVLDAPKRYGRTPVVIAALAAVLLPILLDGGQPMWRAIFIVELAFLMLTVGARTPNWGGRRPARPRGGLLLPRRGDTVARARGDPAGDDHDGHRHRADRAPPARQPGAHHPVHGRDRVELRHRGGWRRGYGTPTCTPSTSASPTSPSPGSARASASSSASSTSWRR